MKYEITMESGYKVVHDVDNMTLNEICSMLALSEGRVSFAILKTKNNTDVAVNASKVIMVREV